MTPALALAAALLAAPPPPARPETLTLPVHGAYDADTLYARLPSAPGPLRRVSIRLEGVDTPERGWRAQCPAEAEMAERARVRTLALLAGVQAVTVVSPRWGKYGGRIVGRVLIGTRDLAADLIARKLGRPYDGGARMGWCDTEREERS